MPIAAGCAPSYGGGSNVLFLPFVPRRTSCPNKKGRSSLASLFLVLSCFAEMTRRNDEGQFVFPRDEHENMVMATSTGRRFIAIATALCVALYAVSSHAQDPLAVKHLDIGKNQQSLTKIDLEQQYL